MTLLLNRDDVVRLLTMEDTIAAVEDGFRHLASGAVTMPQRTAIRVAQPPGVHLGMPAYIGGGMDALALKVVTVYPENPARHKLPTTLGTILLNDPRTGVPLAIMEAGYLTAMRTGAASGVATKYLARADARRVGVFGAGVQAQTQLWAVTTVRTIESAVVYDCDPTRARNYAQTMAEKLGISVTAAVTPQEAVEGADIVIVATSANQPVFDGRWLEAGQHVNAIGSHAPQTRELDTAAVARATIVADLPDACFAEAGDVIIPLNEGAITREQVKALGDIVVGKAAGRERPEEITLFKSVGLAIEDASAASFVYRRAIEMKAGKEFSFT